MFVDDHCETSFFDPPRDVAEATNFCCLIHRTKFSQSFGDICQTAVVYGKRSSAWRSLDADG